MQYGIIIYHMPACERTMDRTWLMSLIPVQLFTWFEDFSFRNVVPYVTNN